ncbi:MAG: Uma2 family endonuclease [Catalinimonas sp.]
MQSIATKGVIYPDSDGQPMADNTLQFQWIVTLKTNLDWWFRNDPEVFVAGDLLWYPVQGDPKKRVAPDVLVVRGRPKGHRGSYRQWEEDNQPPQVVIEVLSPGNRFPEMMRKFRFYERYGVEEYLIIDPEPAEISVYRREENELCEVEITDEWSSRQLGLRVVVDEGLHFYHPDGERYRTYDEAQAAALEAQREAERAHLAAERAQQQAERAQQQAERAQQQAEREREAKQRALTELAAMREKLRRAGLE